MNNPISDVNRGRSIIHHVIKINELYFHLTFLLAYANEIGSLRVKTLPTQSRKCLLRGTYYDFFLRCGAGSPSQSARCFRTKKIRCSHISSSGHACKAVCANCTRARRSTATKPAHFHILNMCSVVKRDNTRDGSFWCAHSRTHVIGLSNDSLYTSFLVSSMSAPGV